MKEIKGGVANKTTVDGLLALFGEQFIRQAYESLLGRSPEPTGLSFYLKQLQNGVDKIEILRQLRWSKEGRRISDGVVGLDKVLRHRRCLWILSVGGFFGRKERAYQKRFNILSYQLYDYEAKALKKFDYMVARMADVQNKISDQIVRLENLNTPIEQAVKLENLNIQADSGHAKSEGSLWDMRRVCAYLSESKVFDKDYYLSRYPDVFESGLDPVSHFVEHGWVEGRNPSERFDTKFYLSMYADVKLSGMNPLLHYALHGVGEGRKVNWLESFIDQRGASEYELDVSVIIPTYNRGALLPLVLESWRQVHKVTRYRYEIIFSDDGSSDNSLDTLFAEQELPIQVIKNQHGGASKARNSAIRQAKGEKLLIVGDDIFPNPEIINQHYEKLKELPISKAVLGDVVWHKNLPVNMLMKHITEIGNEQFSFNAFEPHRYIDFRHFYTCNISIDKDFLLSEDIIFNEAFGRYGFEDIELGYRLSQKGMEIYYYPEAVAEHFHSYNDVNSFCRRQENAGAMSIVFRSLHDEKIEWVVQVQSILSQWQDNLHKLELQENDLIDRVVALCQKIEDTNKSENTSLVQSTLSEIYKVLFRFFYEKGVVENKLKFNKTVAQSVFAKFVIPDILPHLEKLSKVISSSDFVEIKRVLNQNNKRVRLQINVVDLEHAATLSSLYSEMLIELQFALPSEAQISNEKVFEYTPSKTFHLHPASVRQALLCLQTYPNADVFVLSFGLIDLPSIGVSEGLNNNVIQRGFCFKDIGANARIKSGKIIRLMTENYDSVTGFHDLGIGEDWLIDNYGFFGEKMLPIFHSSVMPISSKSVKPCIFVFPIFLAVGGVERNTVEIIKQLQDKFNFVIITFERLQQSLGTLHHQFSECCIAIYDLTEVSMHDDILSHLKFLGEKYDPALIWVCNGSPWFAENAQSVRGTFAGIPIVDQQVYDTEAGWVQLHRKKDPGVLSFDRFIAINSKIKEVFVKDVGIQAEKIDLIYSVMSSEKREIALNEQKNTLYKKYKLDKNQKYFAYIGRMTAQKSPVDFLKLIKLIVAKYGTEYKFIMVGSGELDAEVDGYIAENKLSEHVLRFKYIENTFEISLLSEAIVFTSLYEGLSIALLESLSVGTPALSTDVGDTGVTLNRYGGGGVFKSIGNVDEYMIMFDEFIKNLTVYQRNLSTTKAQVAHDFSAKHIAKQYLLCFENAQKDKGSS